jgi:hypothetical protein
VTPPSEGGAAPRSARGAATLDVDGDRPDAGVSAHSNVPAWLVGLAGLVIGVALALRLLIPFGMDPSIFVSFGDESPAHTAYMERHLGQVTTRPDFWPDGKFFFVQANDPLYLEPHQHAVLLDLPIYRGQRMLYPMLAGVFGLLPPRAIVWSLLFTNILGMALGAWLGAKLALLWHGPAWLGLLVPLNIGLLFEFEIGGAGILAYTCCLAALFALEKQRTGVASFFFAAGALSKEAMVAFALGVLLLMWGEHRTFLWRIVVVPVTAISVWHLYLRLRLDGLHAQGPLGAFAAPFVGIFDAFRVWITQPAHLLVNLTILAIILMFVPLALRSRLPIVWGALPFVGLATILSAAVWWETFDLTRALVPVFTAIPFVVVISGHGESRPVLDGPQELT